MITNNALKTLLNFCTVNICQYYQQNILKVYSKVSAQKLNITSYSCTLLHIKDHEIFITIITALRSKQQFNVVVGCGGANFNYFICCWVV